MEANNDIWKYQTKVNNGKMSRIPCTKIINEFRKISIKTNGKRNKMKL